MLKNDFTRKMNDFDTFTKNCLTMWAIGAKLLWPPALNSCPKSNKLANLVTLDLWVKLHQFSANQITRYHLSICAYVNVNFSLHFPLQVSVIAFSFIFSFESVSLKVSNSNRFFCFNDDANDVFFQIRHFGLNGN